MSSESGPRFLFFVSFCFPHTLSLSLSLSLSRTRRARTHFNERRSTYEWKIRGIVSKLLKKQLGVILEGRSESDRRRLLAQGGESSCFSLSHLTASQTSCPTSRRSTAPSRPAEIPPGPPPPCRRRRRRRRATASAGRGRRSARRGPGRRRYRSSLS